MLVSLTVDLLTRNTLNVNRSRLLITNLGTKSVGPVLLSQNRPRDRKSPAITGAGTPYFFKREAQPAVVSICDILMRTLVMDYVL